MKWLKYFNHDPRDVAGNEVAAASWIHLKTGLLRLPPSYFFLHFMTKYSVKENIGLHLNLTSKPTNWRIQRSIGIRTFRYLTSSPPLRFAPSVDDSIPVSQPGRFAPKTISSLDVSPPGRLAHPKQRIQLVMSMSLSTQMSVKSVDAGAR